MEIKIFISDELLKISDDGVVNRAIDSELAMVKKEIMKLRNDKR